MDFESLSKIASTGRKMGEDFFSTRIICRTFQVMERKKNHHAEFFVYQKRNQSQLYNKNGF